MLVHERVAKVLVGLRDRVDPNQIIMPIGFDGAVIYHLLHYLWGDGMMTQPDHLQNTIQASSRTHEFDRRKFREIMQTGCDTGKTVYGLDLRTKTGELGRMLKSYIGPDYAFLYVVLFDHDKHADIRGTTRRLLDRTRKFLYWVPSAEVEREYIREEDYRWVYNLDHERLGKLSHVQDIKDCIQQELEKQRSKVRK